MKQAKFLILLAGIVVFLASCSNKAVENMTNAIPKDALNVYRIDIKSLLKKANFRPLENGKIAELIKEKKESASEGDKARFAKLEEFLKNPNSIGIDFAEDCFIYQNSQAVGLLWAVNSEKKIEELFKNEFETPESDIEKKGDITTVKLNRSAYAGWNSKVFLIIIDSGSSYSFGDDKTDIAELLHKQLTQSASESINTQNGFAEFLKDKTDISLYNSYDNGIAAIDKVFNAILGSDDNADITSVYNKLKGQLSGLSGAAFISFEKGEITLTQKNYFENADSETKMNAFVDRITGTIKGDQLRYFGSQTPVVMFTGNLKGESTYNYLEELGLVKFIDKNGGATLSALGIDLKSQISNIEGDFTIALNSVEMVENDFGAYSYPSPEPRISFFAEMKDAGKLWSLIKEKTANGTMSGCEVIDENTYKLDMKYQFYIGIKDNMFYLTNSNEIYKNFSAANLKNDLMDKAKGNRMFAYGSLNSLEEVAVSSIGTRDVKVLDLIHESFALLGDYQYTVSKDNRGQAKFELTNKDKNSLAAITDLINKAITVAAN